MGKKNKKNGAEEQKDHVVEIPVLDNVNYSTFNDYEHEGHGHSHGSDKGHGHSHGDNEHHHGDHGHGHSHGSPSKSPKNTSSMVMSEDVCSHLMQQTTECGHTECMSDEEIKASDAKRVLIIASCACLFFMVCELIGGYVSNSLAIISDAFHLLSDVLSFMISIISLSYSRRMVGASSAYSFGYHRIEVIGALGSILVIYLLTGVLQWEAFQRVMNPEKIDAPVMFGIAVLGLLVNVFMGLILLSSGHGHSHGGLISSHGHSHGEGEDHGHGSSTKDHGHSHGEGEDHGHSHSESSSLLPSHEQEPHQSILDRIVEKVTGNGSDNINVRAAFVHVLGDAIQSIGVMFAAILIWWKPEYSIADPICTVIFSIIVLFTTFKILKEGVLVLMEGVPAHIDSRAVLDTIKSVDGIVAVHDLHVWTLSAGNTALSVHILVENALLSNQVLQSVQKLLDQKYNISHSTIQVEADGNHSLSCNAAPRGCVKE